MPEVSRQKAQKETDGGGWLPSGVVLAGFPGGSQLPRWGSPTDLHWVWFPPQTLGGSRAPELTVHFTAAQVVAQILLLFLPERAGSPLTWRRVSVVCGAWEERYRFRVPLAASRAAQSSGRLCCSEHSGCCCFSCRPGFIRFPQRQRGAPEFPKAPGPVPAGQGRSPGRPAAAELPPKRLGAACGCRWQLRSVPGLWASLLSQAFYKALQGGRGAPTETRNIVRQISTCPAAGT